MTSTNLFKQLVMLSKNLRPVLGLSFFISIVSFIASGIPNAYAGDCTPYANPATQLGNRITAFTDSPNYKYTSVTSGGTFLVCLVGENGVLDIPNAFMMAFGGNYYRSINGTAGGLGSSIFRNFISGASAPADVVGAIYMAFRYPISMAATLTSSDYDYFYIKQTDNVTYGQGVPYVPTVTVSSTLATSTTWHNYNVYVISGDVEVVSGNTLTLEPGVVVKFATATSSLTINGTLNAIGAAATEDETSVNEIYLTSFLDDAVPSEGDTNNDGTSTAPAAGDWKGVMIGAGGVANFEYVTIRYGGALSGTGALIRNNGGTLSLSTTTLAHGTTYGIKNDAGTTTILGSSVGFNDYGLYLAGGSMSITASSTIHDNSTYGIYNNTTNVIDATNNWWSATSGIATSGPYHSITHATGTGNRVSDYVDYNPWIGMVGEGVHYVYAVKGCPGGCGMANASGTFMWRWASTTSSTTISDYGDELEDAIETWEDVGTSTTFIMSTSSVAEPVVDMIEVDRSDLVWSGQFNFDISLNTYYLDQDTSAQIQHTITHEIGHALGLNHSFPGNILYTNQTSLIELGAQDLFDYHYLWD